jgi:SAM-dependent methyltransferase
MREWIRMTLGAWTPWLAGSTHAHRSLAATYVRGAGIEIGALDRPLPLPRRARVTYVDRLWVPGLRQAHLELAERKLAEVKIVDDIERLERIPDSSQDFVIANRVLEHCEDTLGALRNYHRVLKTGGIAYLASCDCRSTFNRARVPTPLPHVILDHEQGPEWSRALHWEEHTRLVNGVHECDQVAEQVGHLIRLGYDLHYHVWTEKELLELVAYACRRFSFRLECFRATKDDIIAILRKTAIAAAALLPSAA